MLTTRTKKKREDSSKHIVTVIMRFDQLERRTGVDAWLLHDHKMYRVLIPKDSDCLYKAVAELVSG